MVLVKKESNTYIDDVREVSLFKIVQNGGIVEIGQRSHVLTLLKLGRIHLVDLILVELTLRITPRDKGRKDKGRKGVRRIRLR